MITAPAPGPSTTRAILGQHRGHVLGALVATLLIATVFVKGPVLAAIRPVPEDVTSALRELGFRVSDVPVPEIPVLVFQAVDPDRARSTACLAKTVCGRDEVFLVIINASDSRLTQDVMPAGVSRQVYVVLEVRSARSTGQFAPSIVLIDASSGQFLLATGAR